jgi:uncharacterized membrane protein (DUF485 family)
MAFLFKNSIFKKQNMFMKRAIACLLLLFFLLPLLHAQQKVFLRIYNTDGKKISKGYLSATTDSSIILLNGNSREEVSVARIGDIKSHHLSNRILKRSVEVVILTVIIAVVIIYLIMVITDRHHFRNYGNSGNSGPGVSKHVRPLEKYTVNGSQVNWKIQRLLLDGLL